MNSSQRISESSNEASMSEAFTGTGVGVESISEDGMVFNRGNEKIERRNFLYTLFLFLCSSRKSPDLEMFGTRKNAWTSKLSLKPSIFVRTIILLGFILKEPPRHTENRIDARCRGRWSGKRNSAHVIWCANAKHKNQTETTSSHLCYFFRNSCSANWHVGQS